MKWYIVDATTMNFMYTGGNWAWMLEVLICFKAVCVCVFGVYVRYFVQYGLRVEKFVLSISETLHIYIYNIYIIPMA